MGHTKCVQNVMLVSQNAQLNCLASVLLGVDKITGRLEWNSGRKARKGHICEDSLAYASYSSKDIVQ